MDRGSSSTTGAGTWVWKVASRVIWYSSLMVVSVTLKSMLMVWYCRCTRSEVVTPGRTKMRPDLSAWRGPLAR
ncbi:hypothetical protein DETS111669_23565 [Delftia tsuruhatensis]